MKTIFLCGFMGCGKSTTGRLLAKRLGLAFIDLDEYIEEKAAMSIPDIFMLHGESRFRALESEAIAELAGKSAVIACGGGAMIIPENAMTANKNGIFIFLDLPFEVCYNMINDDENRPIAAVSSEAELKALFDKRYPLYLAHSAIAVNADTAPLEAVNRIADAIRDSAKD